MVVFLLFLCLCDLCMLLACKDSRVKTHTCTYICAFIYNLEWGSAKERIPPVCTAQATCFPQSNEFEASHLSFALQMFESVQFCSLITHLGNWNSLATCTLSVHLVHSKCAVTGACIEYKWEHMSQHNCCIWNTMLKVLLYLDLLLLGSTCVDLSARNRHL